MLNVTGKPPVSSLLPAASLACKVNSVTVIELDDAITVDVAKHRPRTRHSDGW